MNSEGSGGSGSPQPESDCSISGLMRRARPEGADVSPVSLQAAQAELLGRKLQLPIGDVEIVRRIGGGAMGTVYEAVQAGSPLALKVLNRLTAQQLYCLKKEFRTLAGLLHPNVVSVYELFGDAETWYFTMELVQGVPLDEHWRALPFDDAGQGADSCRQLCPSRENALRDLLHQLIEGVVATHQAGLVHRDLKPANVLVAANGRVVLVDFGLVSDQHAGGVGQTIDGGIAGTPAYMAAEQVLGRPASPQSDCYAVGVILYQLLTGQLPHTSRAELQTPPRPRPAAPSSLVPGIPADLDELCMSLLDEEPARRPTSDDLLTVSRGWRLADRALSPSPLSRGQSGSFVGRRQVLSQLQQAYRDARARGPTIVIVEGDSGSGKSALLRRFVDDLERAESAFVLQGRCRERESVPHKAFDGIIDQLTRVLLRLPSEQTMQLVPRHVYALTRLFLVLLRVPCLRQAANVSHPTTDAALLRRQGYEALREMFCRIADRRSLVLIIDDLHLSDEDSLRLLADLLAPPDAAHMLLVVTYQRGVGHPEESGLQSVLATPAAFDVRNIVLGNLSLAEASDLAASILDGEPSRRAQLARSIAQETDGVPLYVVKVAQSHVGGADDTRRSLSELIARSIEALPAPARRLFELISSAGRPIPLGLLARASGCALVHESLAELRAGQLVRVTTDVNRNELFEAYHERVRQTCMARMSREQLHHCRTQLIEALCAAETSEPEWLCELYHATGASELAAHHALGAGHRANAALAFHLAADLFGRALAYLDASAAPARRAELHELRAGALANVGQYREAADAFTRAAALSNGHDALRLASSAVRQWLRSGHLEQAILSLRGLFRDLGIAWPRHRFEAIAKLSVNRARARWTRLSFTLDPAGRVPPKLMMELDALHPAQTFLGMFDYVLGAYFASVALPLALRSGNPRHIMSSLLSEAIYSSMWGGTQGSARAFSARTQLAVAAPAAGEPLAGAVQLLAQAMCAYWEGRWAEVEELSRAAADLFSNEVLDGSWEGALALSLRSSVSIHSGTLVAAQQELSTKARQAQARNNLYALRDVQRSLASTYLMADDVAQAETTVRTLERNLADQPRSAFQLQMTSSSVALHLYRGEPEQAAARLAAGRRTLQALGFQRLPLVALMLIGMQADCLACSPSASPRERAQGMRKLARTARDVPITWAGALSHSLLAHAERFDARVEQAARQLDLASAAFMRCGMRLPAAVCRLRSAELHPDREAEHARERSARDLRGMGIVAPERWKLIVHSLF